MAASLAPPCHSALSPPPLRLAARNSPFRASSLPLHPRGVMLGPHGAVRGAAQGVRAAVAEGGEPAPMGQVTRYNDSPIDLALMGLFRRKMEQQIGGERDQPCLLLPSLLHGMAACLLHGMAACLLHGMAACLLHGMAACLLHGMAACLLHGMAACLLHGMAACLLHGMAACLLHGMAARRHGGMTSRRRGAIRGGDEEARVRGVRGGVAAGDAGAVSRGAARHRGQRAHVAAATQRPRHSCSSPWDVHAAVPLHPLLSPFLLLSSLSPHSAFLSAQPPFSLSSFPSAAPPPSSPHHHFPNPPLPRPAVPQFRKLFPPSKWSAEINAAITVPGFQWLVGPCQLKEVEVNGQKQMSGVHVTKCRYLEVSGCVGMCVNMCKLPTQDFFTNDFGLPLTMTPNFEDMSCEMVFGQMPPPLSEDPALSQPCFAALCSMAQPEADKCPRVPDATP
ncbi:unnamed protein product [Closterium sp. Naga37s-1]|nr:unnamed protein product [Closterium sp. Naga37s-1]